MRLMKPQYATLGDLPSLTRILWDCSRVQADMPQVRTRLTDLLLLIRITRRGWVRLICDDTGPAAFIARNGTRIHALYVHPRAQGQGLGRALLRDAQAAAPQLDLFVLQANLKARRFYMCHGFAQRALGDGAGNDENLPDLHMVWQGGTF